MTTLETYAEELEEIAETSRPSAKRTITKVVALLRGRTFLKTGQVAERLDIGSINTVKRLAEDGFLQGAFKDERGTWHIPLSAVVALEKEREQTHLKSVSRTKGIRVSTKVSPRLSGRSG